MANFNKSILQNGSTYFKKSMGGDYQCPHCGYQRSSNNVWAPVLHDVIKLFIHFLIYLFRMAKGNMLQADARGRVGQVVFKVLKGQQITSKYQSNVANPKTTAQMQQRARFANAVKFYKHATQNFFKFAYEDKRKTESDFNAFMRHNLTKGNSIILPKDLVEGTFPALAKSWILTSGRLSNSVELSIEGGETTGFSVNLLDGYNFSLVNGDVTVANFSKQVIDQGYGAKEGDIITCVMVTSKVTNITDGNPVNYPSWRVTQFVLNLSDFTSLTNYGFVIDGEILKLGFTKDYNPEEYTAWGSIVTTRNTDSGLLCDNSSLLISEESLITEAVNAQSSSLTSWNPSGTAILKGAIAANNKLQSYSPAPGESVTVDVSVPNAQAELTVYGPDMSGLTKDDVSAKSTDGATGVEVVSVTPSADGKSAVIVVKGTLSQSAVQTIDVVVTYPNNAGTVTFILSSPDDKNNG